MLVLKRGRPAAPARTSVTVTSGHPEGVAMDRRYPSGGQPAGPARAVRGTGHRGWDPTVPPDPGCYEERYKVAGAALSLAAGLLALGLLVAVAGWHPQLIIAAFSVLLAIPTVLVMALRPVAFRADHAGVTLGAVRVLPPRPAVFIPWADIENIILYPEGSGRKAVECVGVQRREGAPALPYGNKWAPGCPVSGVAAGAARRMTHWRLDRERLAAVTAAVAPGIPIIETGKAIPSGALGDQINPWGGRPPRQM
jgi:hypothetical protein